MIAALILAQIIVIEAPPPTKPGDYVPGTLRIEPAPAPPPGFPVPLEIGRIKLQRC